MPKYVVECPHTPEECTNTLNEVLAQDPKALDKIVWGCGKGVHTGWAYVDAKSKEDALAMIPESGRKSAKATEVSKFTPEQIKAAHK